MTKKMQQEQKKMKQDSIHEDMKRKEENIANVHISHSIFRLIWKNLADITFSI